MIGQTYINELKAIYNYRNLVESVDALRGVEPLL